MLVKRYGFRAPETENVKNNGKLETKKIMVIELVRQLSFNFLMASI
jgi:hypothetical protein